MNNSAYLIEQDGKVAVYRGLNEELFGIPLSNLEYTSGVEVDKLNPGVANRIKEGMAVAVSKKQIISLQPINKRLRFKKATLQAIAPLLMPPTPQKPTTLRAILGQIPIQILIMQKTPEIPTTPSVVNSL